MGRKSHFWGENPRVSGDAYRLVRGWSHIPSKVRTLNRLAGSGGGRGRRRAQHHPRTLRHLIWQLILLPVRLLAVALWIALVIAVIALIVD